jgi:hypothetical protein
MLSYANMAIDAVQNAKSGALKTFVTDESIRKPLQAFVDAQTTFAKEVAKVSNDFYNLAVSKVSSK